MGQVLAVLHCNGITLWWGSLLLIDKCFQGRTIWRVLLHLLLHEQINVPQHWNNTSVL